jgi:hypothetical protein
MECTRHTNLTYVRRTSSDPYTTVAWTIVKCEDYYECVHTRSRLTIALYAAEYAQRCHAMSQKRNRCHAFSQMACCRPTTGLLIIVSAIPAFRDLYF